MSDGKDPIPPFTPTLREKAHTHTHTQVWEVPAVPGFWKKNLSNEIADF